MIIEGMKDIDGHVGIGLVKARCALAVLVTLVSANCPRWRPAALVLNTSSMKSVGDFKSDSKSPHARMPAGLGWVQGAGGLRESLEPLPAYLKHTF